MIYILFMVQALAGYRTPLVEKIDPQCYDKEWVRAWVYFTDKAVSVDGFPKALDLTIRRLANETRERRLNRNGVFDLADLPVDHDYCDAVSDLGGFLITRSKWLNAASFWMSRQDLEAVAGLDFVYKITPVAGFQGSHDTEAARQDTSVYGITYYQLKMFAIDELHDRGIFGSNVKIGILDSGLRKKHIALNNTKILAEYDFTDKDQIFLEDIPVTDRSGTYSDIEFQGSGSRLNLFLTGDFLVANVYPARDILYTYSTDNGNSWSPLSNLSNNPALDWVTELEVCGRDTLFVFYRNRYNIRYLAYSIPGEAIINSGTLAGASCREPASILIGDTVYVAYQNNKKLYLAKGTAAGFGSTATIDSATDQIKNPVIVGRGSAELGAFYYTYPGDSLYFIKAGLPVLDTFSKNYLGQARGVDATASRDTIWLVWKDHSDAPLSRLAYSRSTDFGATFSAPQYLSGDLNTMGKIAVERFENKVVAAWETEGRVYSATSYDYGTSFGSVDSLDQIFCYLPTPANTGSDVVKFFCQRGDSITDGFLPTDPDYFHPRHGTEMLGLIGGYLSGYYVGVAPGAQFLIAKTENPSTSYEFPVEEDTWITGLEWVEANGADIVNSSLGYTAWYAWPDEFNGQTSPASIAAQAAAERGMIIVNSAGNVTFPQIVIPGDAPAVITAGGIDTLFNRWASSGYFPTENHTVKKPELVCLSAAPIVVNPDTADAYLYSFGTSGAAAMVSGICALLLEGHPSWNVDSVRQALFATASFADTPSDSMGYGWPDALAAFNYSAPAVDTIPGTAFLTPYPNPFIVGQHQNIILPFKLNRAASVELYIYSVTGRLVKKERREGLLAPGRYTDPNPGSPNAAFNWDGTDDEGRAAGTGIYYCLLVTRGAGNHLIKIGLVR